MKTDPIVEAVREKLLQRSQIGLNKYGVGLDRKDLTYLDWLNHTQQEMMDAANYLEVLIQNETSRIQREQSIPNSSID